MNTEKTNRYRAIEKEGIRKRKATKHINLGVAIFAIILTYLIFVMITFFIREKVDYTTAEMGVLTHSNIYKGLVIRDETVISSEAKGAVRYMSTEGARTRSGITVAGVLKNPDMIERLDEEITKENRALPTDDSLFDESYEYLKNRIKNYVINKHLYNYEYTYSIKKQIMNDISDIRNTVIRESSLKGEIGATIALLEEQYKDYIDYYYAPISGLVSYNIDGFESITITNFSDSDLEREPKIQEISKKVDVEEGQALFKIVDNYLWYIVTEIDHECELKIKDKNYIGVEFTEKDIQLDVEVLEIQNVDEKVYLILKVDRLLNEFLSERFVQFKIVYDQYDGIKVPESAVLKKTYLEIPITYLYGDMINKKILDEDEVGGFIGKAIYLDSMKTDDEFAYVPVSENLDIGDELLPPSKDSILTDTFIISNTKELEGVYIVNKGFAEFKLIETKYNHIDYRIVNVNTSYGIKVYDRIATEASTTREYQIIN